MGKVSYIVISDEHTRIKSTFKDNFKQLLKTFDDSFASIIYESITKKLIEMMVVYDHLTKLPYFIDKMTNLIIFL